jgi:hypothetical protein
MEAIARAQRDGVISAKFPAATLLDLIHAISMAGLLTANGSCDAADTGRLRAPVKEAVRGLLSGDPDRH